MQYIALPCETTVYYSKKNDNSRLLSAQIQNEFIQQGCLNFRLIPVLFPNATKVSARNKHRYEQILN